MKTRTEEMIELRNSGKSLQEIADVYKISRERVRQLIGNTGRKFLREYAEKNIIVSEFMTTKASVSFFGRFPSITKKRMSLIHHIVSSGIAKKGEEVERLVCKKLESIGHKCKMMPYGSEYDILINDVTRIEVKASFKKVFTNKSAKHYGMYHFGIKKRKDNCDFFICYIKDFDVYFVIPSSEVNNTSSLYISYPYPDRSWAKWKKFEDKFDLLG